MNVEEIVSKCLTGGCEYLDIQEGLRLHQNTIPILIIILLILTVIMVWRLEK